jgi:HEAT repeat protein
VERNVLKSSLKHGAIAFLLALSAANVGRAEFPPIDQPLEFGLDQFDIPETPRINVTSPRTVQLLGEAITPAQSVERRSELLTDLARTDLPAALPYILKSFSDPSPAVRASAATAAGNLRQSEASQPLLSLVDDTDPAVRAAAVKALGKLSDDAALGQAVTKLLNDADESVVSAALNAARGSTTGDAIAGKISSFSPRLQIAAVRALGRSGQASHGAVAARLLGDNVALSAAALQAIAELKDQSQTQAVQSQLSAAHPSVRREALLALPSLVDAATVRKLVIGGLKDSDDSVKTAAARLVQPLDQADQIPVLIGLLEIDNAALHQAVRDALSSCPEGTVRQASIAAAVKLLDHSDLRRKEDGSYVLGQYASHEGFDKHLALISSTPMDGSLLSQLCKSMGQIGDRKAADAVTDVATQGVDALVKGAVTMGPGPLMPAAPPVAGETPAPTTEPAPEPAASPLLNPNFEALDEALVTLGQFKHQPGIALAQTVLAQSAERSPAIPRPPAAYLLGTTGGAEQISVLSRVMADMFEGPNTKFEAIKAIGNINDNTNGTAASAVTNALNNTRDTSNWWIAQWTLKRLGAPVPEVAAPAIRTSASVSIVDLNQ